MTLLALPMAVRTQPHAEAIVTRIIRADYEGDRAALERLHKEIGEVNAKTRDATHSADCTTGKVLRCGAGPSTASTTTPRAAALERDLQTCCSDFEASRKADPAFTDATVGQIGCLQTLTFLHRSDPTKWAELVARFVPLFKEAEQQRPEIRGCSGCMEALNGSRRPAPRLTRSRRNRPAMATYRRGLELARKQRRPPSVLEPTWGEPELLMSLAWASLNQLQPDRAAAEKYAAKRWRWCRIGIT